MEATRAIYFDHEKLEVYQEAIAFVAWLSPILDALSRPGDVKEQLDCASTSIALNIAEGNGRHSTKERSRFFETSCTSALECASGLDILVAKAKLTTEQIHPGKERLRRIVNMLFGLLRKLNEDKYQPKTRKSE